MSDTTLQNEFSLKLTNATRCFFLSNHRVSIMRKSNARALGIDARRREARGLSREEDRCKRWWTVGEDIGRSMPVFDAVVES